MYIRKQLTTLASLTLLLASSASLPALAQPAAAPVPLQAAEDIAAVATAHALSLLEAGEYLDVTATAQPMDSRLRLRQCELPLEAGSTAALLKPGRVSISVRCSGSTTWSLFVPVVITARAPVVVLKGPLPRGTIISAEHLELRELPVDKLPPNYLGRVDAVIGQELTRHINQESYATAAMLKLRKLVEKGQQVVILAQSGSLEVKMAGEALEPGQLGDRISVRNSVSGRTVQGRLTGAGTVLVNL